MKSNFTFLQIEWDQIFEYAHKAEQSIHTEPMMAGVYSRVALEETVKTIYGKNYLTIPFNSTLFSLMSHVDFKKIVPYAYLSGVDKFTRVTGNGASHGKRITNTDALIAVKYLFPFLKWFAIQYNLENPNVPAGFDESFIPQSNEHLRKLKEMQDEILRLEKEAEEKEAIRKIQVIELKEQLQLNELMKQNYEQIKETQLLTLEVNRTNRDFSKIKEEFTEAETRQHLIDISLKMAGWDSLRKGKDFEYPVVGMPILKTNATGKGFADYVLWDDNGLPLAVIEAKRSSIDAESGRIQASIYADCLEKMHKQRPVIFYTNGYDTFIWDDTFYTHKKVSGIFSKEELQWLVKRRKSRKDLKSIEINNEITNRDYQKSAITRVAERFCMTMYDKKILRGGHRKALLVMATGSGKTRTAASLVEVLFKAGWIQKVLFLADRRSLVRQAKTNFSKYLPDYITTNLLEEAPDAPSRIVFSTYPTMMNKIDDLKKNGKRYFGPGHFDLIIIDEAHRSIYKKYAVIFEYFDSLLIGLTATPKGEIHKDTYAFFECPKDDPTYSFELDEAVEKGHLVPPKRFELTTRFLREGIKYSDLTEEEKESYESSFEDSDVEVIPDEVESTALIKWLFNQDTVDKILVTLMKEGIHIESGDRLAKTIIFAANQAHAKYITARFNALYPQHSGKFIETIYHGVSHVQDLIDKFCNEKIENDPRIVVSVDMMDTGIDAPRVANLVFFKMVKSYSKFWQMIGRGTRICVDLFGPEKQKTEFKVFDTCGNFEFFDENPKGVESQDLKSLTQQIFEAKLDVGQLLAKTGEEDNLKIAHGYLNELNTQIAQLDQTGFIVQSNLRYVHKFLERNRWNNLNNDDLHEIKFYLSALPRPDKVHESVRKFRLLVLRMQQAKLETSPKEKLYADHLLTSARQLGEKYTLPEVLAKKDLIEQMKSETFYEGISHQKLEVISKEISPLLKNIIPEKYSPIFMNILDSDIIVEEGEIKLGASSETYQSRVEKFIRENKNNITIYKLANNEPITKMELEGLENILFDGGLRGSKEDFIKVYGPQPLGKFIRSIVGLEVTAARRAFSTFMDAGELTGDQQKFIDNIISFLTVNGTIDKRMLSEQPFNEMHDQGIFGIFIDDAQVEKVISIIDQINDNAGMMG